MAERRNVLRLLGALAVLGGGLLVVGSLLTWIELPQGPIGFEGGRVDDDAVGVDSPYGLAVLVAGAVAAVAGLALLTGRPVLAAPWAVLLAGAVGIAIVVVSASTLDDRFVDASVASAAEDSGDKVERLVDGLLDNGTISTRAAAGLPVAGAGGGLALLAGLGSLVALRRRDRRSVRGTAPVASG